MAIKNAYSVKPSELKAGDIFPYQIVAVVGYTGQDWAAYRAPWNWSPEEVAANGDKIPQAAAEVLYPTLAAVLTWRD